MYWEKNDVILIIYFVLVDFTASWERIFRDNSVTRVRLSRSEEEPCGRTAEIWEEFREIKEENRWRLERSDLKDQKRSIRGS